MKYTVYKIFNKTLNEIYLSAGRGILNLQNFRIQNKSILNKTKNYETKIELITNVQNKEEIFPRFIEYIKCHPNEAVTIFHLNKKIPIFDENNNEIYVYREELIPIDNKKYFSIQSLPDRIFTKKIYKTKETRKRFKHTNLNTYRKIKVTNKCKIKYPEFTKPIHSLDGKVFIEKFCEHGNISLSWREFNAHYKFNKGIYICEKCTQQIIDSLVLNENELREMFRNIDNQDRSYRLYKENYMKKYLPDLYKAILDYSDANSFSEKIFRFKNEIKSAPICNYDNCKLTTKFSQTAKMYNMYCEKHKFTFNVSQLQKEVKDFVANCLKDKEILETYRKFKKEIDIFIPHLNLGIEVNGLYHHSDIFKSPQYHHEKQKLFEDNGIHIMYIWEDDWKNKQEIVKSIIRNRLHVITEKIYARNCILKQISYNESKVFLQNNHLQSFCPSSINLGLFYKNELVSIMTFGKRRMILNSTSGNNEYELLRFCNRINLNVIGAASKLFSHFLKTYTPTRVISYANKDMFDGALYYNLGFTINKYTGPNYWWAKDGIKYSRSNFMKFKLVAAGENCDNTEDEIMRKRKYLKIWNAGNLKFIYDNNI